MARLTSDEVLNLRTLVTIRNDRIEHALGMRREEPIVGFDFLTLPDEHRFFNPVVDPLSIAMIKSAVEFFDLVEDGWVIYHTRYSGVWRSLAWFAMRDEAAHHAVILNRLDSLAYG